MKSFPTANQSGGRTPSLKVRRLASATGKRWRAPPALGRFQLRQSCQPRRGACGGPAPRRRFGRARESGLPRKLRRSPDLRQAVAQIPTSPQFPGGASEARFQNRRSGTRPFPARNRRRLLNCGEVRICARPWRRSRLLRSLAPCAGADPDFSAELITVGRA